MTKFKRFAVLPFMMLSLACSALSVKQPTATFKSANVTDITAQGFTMAFDLNVQNPNAVALPISKADYKLGLGGVNVLEGKAKPDGTLPANGNLDVKLPVTVTFENLLAAEKAIVSGGGNLPYALTGSLGFDAGSGLSSVIPVSVPLKYEGSLNVNKLLQEPQLLMNSPAAKKLASQLVTGYFSH